MQKLLIRLIVRSINRYYIKLTKKLKNELPIYGIHYGYKK